MLRSVVLCTMEKIERKPHSNLRHVAESRAEPGSLVTATGSKGLVWSCVRGGQAEREETLDMEQAPGVVGTALI